MISSLEVIERSVYYAILERAVELNLCVDPEKYYPVTPESIQQFKEDKEKLTKYVSVYGAGTSTSRGVKLAPRIVIDSQGFYPGSMGMVKTMITPNLDGFDRSEFPYEALDQMIEIRLVTESQEDMRLLHNVLFYSIPQRGYIKPWPNKTFKPSGNIFIEVVNFFNKSDNTEGILEKVYQFMIYDCVLEPVVTPTDFVPLNEVELILESSDTETFKFTK